MLKAEDYIVWEDGDSDGWITTWKSSDIVKYINQARIDTIKVCAEAAEVEFVGMESSGYETVNKQSILKLIDELE